MENSSDEKFAQPIFENGCYRNPKPFTMWSSVPGPRQLMGWWLDPDRSNIPTSEKELHHELPLIKPNFDLDAELKLTWIGHATVVVTLDGVTFLTDPIWSNHCSPTRFFGPKRYRLAPCSINQLPKIDFAVISHNHYDHLDKNSVQELQKRFKGLHWFVPAGLKSWMEQTGCRNVRELSWGEEVEFNNGSKSVKVHCLPAQHWSGRSLFDNWKSLWCGWAVVGPTRRFYFAGDTGFCEEEFNKIGRILGPFDLAAIPIGCYEPSWFMSPQHIGPEEAVKIHQMVKSKQSIGVHWGTFHMGSHEPYLEPRSKLKEAVMKAALDPRTFITVRHGETIAFPASTDYNSHV